MNRPIVLGYQKQWLWKDQFDFSGKYIFSDTLQSCDKFLQQQVGDKSADGTLFSWPTEFKERPFFAVWHLNTEAALGSQISGIWKRADGQANLHIYGFCLGDRCDMDGIGKGGI